MGSYIFCTSENLETLTPNIYNIQNISTQYRLTLPTSNQSQLVESGLGFMVGQIPVYNDRLLDDGFKLIRENTNIYYIKAVANDRSLHYDTSGRVSYQKYNEEHKDSFLWSISRNSKGGFVLKAKQSDGILGMIKKEEGRGYALGLAVPTIQEDIRLFEWRLHSLYPEAGYSNFNDIIVNCGHILAKKYGVSLVETKTQPTSSYGACGLSVKLNKPAQYITLDPEVDDIARISVHEIFKTEEHYNSYDQSTRSLYKFSRVIEVEETFQATIENSLGAMEASSTAKEHRKSQQMGNTLTRSEETIDQRGFNEKLLTQANISLSTSQNAHADISRSGTQSLHKGISKGENKSAQVSLAGEASYQFKAGGGIKTPFVSAETSHTIAGTVKAGKIDTANISNVSQEDTTLTSHSSKSIGVSRENQAQHGEHKGREREQQTFRNKKRSNDYQEIHSGNDEDATMQTINISRTLNLGEVKTTVKKRMQQWTVEREIYQAPNTTLTIRVFEKILEAENVRIEADVNISGYVGFKFSQPVTNLSCNPYKDYFDGEYWYLSPETIISYLPVPGYAVSREGSIDYTIRAKLALKHPIDIITKIDESTCQQFNEGEEV